MPDKKPNRISSLLGSMPADSKRPLAKELGEQDENPAEMDGDEPSDDAKKEIGSKVIAAFHTNDPIAMYEAICSAYRLESTGSAGKGPEDAEEPYDGST